MTEAIRIPASIFNLTVEDVFRAQGADPAVLRSRRPALVETTQAAIELGLKIVRPVGWIKELEVLSTQHNRMILADDTILTGELVLNQLAGSRIIAYVIASLGPEMDEQISDSMKVDTGFGYALDTIGSILAESAGGYFESQIREKAARNKQSISLTLSPGLIGWPVDEGQIQIFKVLQPDQTLIQLNASSQMIPRKSVSYVMGIGCTESDGTTCDFCDQRDRCPNSKARKE